MGGEEKKGGCLSERMRGCSPPPLPTLFRGKSEWEGPWECKRCHSKEEEEEGISRAHLGRTRRTGKVDCEEGSVPLFRKTVSPWECPQTYLNRSQTWQKKRLCWSTQEILWRALADSEYFGGFIEFLSSHAHPKKLPRFFTPISFPYLVRLQKVSLSEMVYRKKTTKDGTKKDMKWIGRRLRRKKEGKNSWAIRPCHRVFSCLCMFLFLVSFCSLLLLLFLFSYCHPPSSSTVDPA